MNEKSQNRPSRYWWRSGREKDTQCAVAAKPGSVCPRCGEGELAYDGLFLLTCPRCGYVAENGAFT